jgi:hypothetical protein
MHRAVVRSSHRHGIRTQTDERISRGFLLSSSANWVSTTTDGNWAPLTQPKGANPNHAKPKAIPTFAQTNQPMPSHSLRRHSPGRQRVLKPASEG